MKKNIHIAGFIALLGLWACGKGDRRPDAPAQNRVWAGDAFFAEAPMGAFGLFTQDKTQRAIADTLPGRLCAALRVPPNEEERQFFHRWKMRLDSNRTLYAIDTDDEGYRNVWLYLWDAATTKGFGATPLLAAYYYREDEQTGALESWLSRDTLGGLSIWQQEYVWYTPTDSLPHTATSDSLMGWRLGATGFERTLPDAGAKSIDWYHGRARASLENGEDD